MDWEFEIIGNILVSMENVSKTSLHKEVIVSYVFNGNWFNDKSPWMLKSDFNHILHK